MSLYLKYRPTELGQIRGNEEIVAALEGMLSNLKTCPHAFLLHGPTGCGKTSIGRIISDRLGCVGGDFREMDIGDFRGIDTIRELRRNSDLSPMEGRCRVWLLDEAHKLTGDAQAALLKILEDTPAHVYIILCTTDPQKLLTAIHGRCQQFQVRVLTETQMMGLLRRVIKDEGETVSRDIMEQVAQASLGRPRNALQILEQVLSVSEEERTKISLNITEEQTQVIELARALMKKGTGWKEVSVLLTGLKDKEPEELRRGILGYCAATLLKGENDRAAFVMEELLEPTYNSGMNQIIYACYSIIKN